MNVESLIQLMENRLIIMNNAKAQTINSGDLDSMNKADQEIFSIKDTISQLRMLLAISNAAAVANVPVVDAVTSGVQAAQNSANIPDNPASPLNLYDLSTYAADPLYLQKITDILTVMGSLDTATAIDVYINSESIGSPLTGSMIFNLAGQYAVDTRLLVAMLELESNFGTAGVAVYTLNPGNVGNTGSATRTYANWNDGVAAVAEWLNNHRKVSDTPPITTDTQTSTSTPATTTPDVIIPITTSSTTSTSTATTTVPFTFASSTPPVFVPIGSSTTTPPISTTTPPVGTSTPPFASSTPPVIPPVASSTDPIATSTPITGTSTPPVTGSSTPPVASSTDPIATPTPTPVPTPTPTPIPTDAGSTTPPVATSTPGFTVPPAGTSTPDVASSTQAINWFGKGKKKKV